MKVKGKHFRSIWWNDDRCAAEIIDQKHLPHDFKITVLSSTVDFASAISDMKVRGAPLIGATAAYGVASAMQKDASTNNLIDTYESLLKTRPTAINLRWALDKCMHKLSETELKDRATASLKLAHEIANEDVQTNFLIGQHGVKLLREISESKQTNQSVQILTHCNAGWLATVDWGTATSPIYQALEANIALHVWVDETRPRNQGTLTAWELENEGVPHTFITDNAGGHLMQRGLVDIVITGTDRTTSDGDVCNKIGTYLKALAAHDCKVPFYVALPSSTIDWGIRDGIRDIPIEERSETEVTHVKGLDDQGRNTTIRILSGLSRAKNPAFDVTPSRLITGLITERGICDASQKGLAEMFPDFSGHLRPNLGQV
jgi:methylthioribose-1-phosphate isomerase